MKYSFLEEYNLQLVEFGHVFDVNVIKKNWRHRSTLPNHIQRSRAPMLVDLRQARLLQLESDDIIRLARMRLQLGSPETKVCCWVSEDGSFGMLRMYAAYAEILGIRKETDFDIYFHAAEILSWLTNQAGLPGTDAQTLIAERLL